MFRCILVPLIVAVAVASARGEEDLERLIEAFASGPREARIEAARKLGRLGAGAAPAVPVLIRTLEDEDPVFRGMAAKLLGEIGPAAAPAVPSLLRHLNAEFHVLRRNAIAALGKIGPASSSAVPALRETLAHEMDARVRRTVVRALHDLGSGVPGACDGLIAALADTDLDVRRAALTALRDFTAEARKLIPVLVKALHDEHEDIRRDAAWSLESFGPDARPAIPRLLDMLTDPVGSVRISAARALEHVGASAGQVVPALTAALEDENVGVRRTAAETLGAFGTNAAPAAPALVGLLADEETCEGAAKALGKIRTGLPLLLTALRHESPIGRRGAAEAIGGFGRAATEATPALVRAFRDEDESVRSAALEALSLVFPAAELAIPVFIEVLEGPYGDLERLQVSMGLSWMGPAAEPAIPALIRALGIPRLPVRLAVMRALAAIGTPTAARTGDLSEIVRDFDEPLVVRVTACLSLQTMGPEARAAVPHLVRALRDPVRELRPSAANALEQILTPGDALISLLEPLLAHEDPEVRRLAARVRDSLRK